MLVTRQPLLIEDVTQDPRFAHDVAETTGYLPSGLMAVPLLHKERALGVLEVLDRAAQASSPLAEMDLLALFADQAAIALDLLQSARRARAALEGSSGELGVVGRLALAVDQLPPERRALGTDLLAALERLLQTQEPGGKAARLFPVQALKRWACPVGVIRLTTAPAVQPADGSASARQSRNGTVRSHAEPKSPEGAHRARWNIGRWAERLGPPASS